MCVCEGTMLIDVDTSILGKVLNPSKAKLESKGVASVQQRVLNLKVSVMII
jgi:lipoate-protein ligase A